MSEEIKTSLEGLKEALEKSSVSENVEKKIG